VRRQVQLDEYLRQAQRQAREEEPLREPVK
jgi:hypothetical protein